MTGAKFDIKKFDGTGDFGLWRIKMRALLIQHGCEASLEILPADMEAQTKAELNKKAHSALGDNKECKIKGIGKVMIQLRDGSSFVLHNVRYIPELKRNLISLGILEKEGFIVKLQSGKVMVINGSSVVLFGIRRDNCIYALDGHAMAGELNASVEEKDSLMQVWHKRLGHIREARLQVLEKQGCLMPDAAAKWASRTAPSTAIEKNTTMDMWSGHPSDYGMLRILGYPKGVKGYRLYKLDDESPKIVTSRNVVFNESLMYKDTLKDFSTGDDKSVKEL
ncbi:retrotransposon protein, putative, ty1-copia subclass [Tanacetum coccineum]